MTSMYVSTVPAIGVVLAGVLLILAYVYNSPVLLPLVALCLLLTVGVTCLVLDSVVNHDGI